MLFIYVRTLCIATGNCGVRTERNSEYFHGFEQSDSQPERQVSAGPGCVLMLFHQQMLLWISGLGIAACKGPLGTGEMICFA